jgi:hypothetical protein
MRAAAAVFVALALTAAAGARSDTTRIQLYRPIVDGKVASGFTVAKTAKGRCFSGSSADARSDAWRCFIGANLIADPCFAATPPRGWVVCPLNGSPFSNKLVKLTLTSALPKAFANHGSFGGGNPWAIKLVGGQVCTFLTGATFAYHGKRVNYGCTETTFLAGSPDRTHPTWTITLGTGPRSQPKTAVILTAVW